ncbi:MAG TPA: hypothetical protein VGE34_00620 [Candidatus Saccharimonadales bacterium]
MEREGTTTEAPELNKDRMTVLRDLLALAQQAPDNSVWYGIERGDGEAAGIVFKIINKHIMREGSEPFASFILHVLQDMISEEEQKSIQDDVPKKESLTVPEAISPKSDSLDAKIKAALGRHSAGRRQWSNQHSRPRR